MGIVHGADGRSGCRRLAVLLLAIGLALAFAASAFALGELTQKPGEAGCISEAGIGGCAKGRGLDEAIEGAISPDGKNFYVAARDSNALAVFGRDPATGALTETGCFSEPAVDGCTEARALKGARSVVVSPDGKVVYVVSLSSNAVAVFDRNPADGALEQRAGEAGCVSQGGAGGCAKARAMSEPGRGFLSADGSNFYVASKDQVAIFDRDAEGTLTQPGGKGGCLTENGSDGGGGECERMRQHTVVAIAFSADGKTAYASGGSDDLVGIFDRDGAGKLTQKPGMAGCVSVTGTDGRGGECAKARGLKGAQAMTVSPDGKNLYVSAFDAEVLVVFDLDPAGTPTQKEGAAGCISVDGSDGAAGPCQSGRGLVGPQLLTVSPDGRSLYLPSFNSHSLATFDRAADGSLTQRPAEQGCLADFAETGVCGLGNGFRGPDQAIVSPDGRDVYMIDLGASSVLSFDRAGPVEGEVAAAPVVAGFKFTPRRFSPKPSGKGTRIRFQLSEPASVRIALERVRKVALGRPRFVRAGVLRRANRPAGANVLSFAGRVRGRALRPGRYRATVVATDAGGKASAPRRAFFTVRGR